MTNSNIDPTEIAKFSELSSRWWDPEGELKSLHDINPLRLQYIHEKASLSSKKVLDIGCGGGILAESMATLGANVTAIDMSDAAIEAAKEHQAISGTQIEYLTITAESLAEERSQQFDVITCMELLEHVPDPFSVIQAAARLIKPGGQIFLSTINRNAKSYVFAIIGAEYLLKLLPANTHDFAKFIRPSELAAWARLADLSVRDLTGMSYNPLIKKYKFTSDLSVNYLVHLSTTLDD